MKNVYILDPKTPAQACMIWMHGLGSDAHDMMSLANQLSLSAPIRHVCLNAPIRPVTINNHMLMRGWYDIVGFNASDREDRVGILSSEALIHDVLESQLKEGFKSEQLFLAGFSQGGAMALFTGLNHDGLLGGIISLSAYLPIVTDCYWRLDKRTPIFMGFGAHDPIVLPMWTQQSATHIKKQGYEQLAMRQYPIAHQVSPEEVQDLVHWIHQHLSMTTAVSENKQ